MVADQAGNARQLAPNSNYIEGSQPWVHYTSISEIAQGALPLLALAVAAKLSLLGKCFDFEKWFRQIGQCNLDRWQIVEMWRGEYFHDTRVTMGCVHSSNTGQRIAFIIIDIVQHTMDEQIEEALDSLTDREAAKDIGVWRKKRMCLFPNEPAQWRPWFMASYQDDTPTMVIAPLAAWVEKVFIERLAHLRVPLSGKEGEFASSFEAIGGRFDFADPMQPRVGPAEETLIEFRADREKIIQAALVGDEMDEESFASMTGRFEWVGRFIADGPSRCATAHACKRNARRHPTRKVKPSAQLLDALAQTDEDIRSGRLRNFANNPCYWHGGTAIAADASTSWGCGWHIGGAVAALEWEAETLQAIEASRVHQVDIARVSISPLELLTQALLAAAVGECMGSEGYGNGQVILRCDNMSACHVVTSRRPRSEAMRAALEMIEQVEHAYGMKIRLEYLRTDLNRTADALSKGQFENARRFVEAEGRVLRWMPLEQTLKVSGHPSLRVFAREGEKRVRNALSIQDLMEV
jgi:hypothetical protein